MPARFNSKVLSADTRLRSPHSTVPSSTARDRRERYDLALTPPNSSIVGRHSQFRLLARPLIRQSLVPDDRAVSRSPSMVKPLEFHSSMMPLMPDSDPLFWIATTLWYAYKIERNWPYIAEPMLSDLVMR